MTSSRNSLRKSLLLAIIISTVSILALCCCIYYIGLRYEARKLKAFLTTLVLVFSYQIFVGDVILLILKASFSAIRLRLPYTKEINPIFVGYQHRKEYLRRKIDALKYQLNLGPAFLKRNQALTLKYKDILRDLLLYGSYLAVLLVLIIRTRDPLAYYNTRTIKDVLRNPKFSPFATSTIFTTDDLYDFINGTIVHGFIDGRSYNGQRYAEDGWTNLQLAKVLGVVRLRQMRHKSLKDQSTFETSHHGPGWLKNPSLPFKDQFWRIFKPWEYQDKSKTGGIDRSGKIHKISGGGYVALLGRNQRNCQRVLEYLRSNNWIDRYTAVVVIEFTLYNVDANVFTLVVITTEQTGFDSLVVTDRIETLKLLVNIDNLPVNVLLLFLVYFVILTKVFADVVLKMWFSNSVKDYFSVSWNSVDIIIVSLNLFIGIGVWIREVYVKKLLLQLEASKKNVFVPFYNAAFIDETCTILVAFLVALATLRLWKILQFARVFRVLTSTLHRAKGSLTSTTFFVAIFLTGIGLGLNIINGANSPSFATFILSITTLMSLSFGFGTTVTPSELNHSGGVVGFTFYVVLVIVVKIFLLNMFITVVCYNFSKEKEKDLEKSKNKDTYTFWQFFKMEIEENFKIKIFKTVSKSNGKPRNGKLNGKECMERMELISEILFTQMELYREKKSQEIKQD